MKNFLAFSSIYAMVALGAVNEAFGGGSDNTDADNDLLIKQDEALISAVSGAPIEVVDETINRIAAEEHMTKVEVAEGLAGVAAEKAIEGLIGGEDDSDFDTDDGDYDDDEVIEEDDTTAA